MASPLTQFVPFSVPDEPSMTPNSKRLVLINDTRVDRHHGCEVAVSAIQTLARTTGFDIVAAAPAHTDFRQDAKFMQTLENADGIVVNGEGSIHANGPRAETLLSTGNVARQLGKPSMLFNCTWGMHDARHANMAQAFDVISVREGKSALELSKAGIHAHIAPDAALFYDWPKVARTEHLLVTDSVLADATRRLMRTSRQQKARVINIRFPDSNLRSTLNDARRMIDKAAPFRPSNLADAVRAAAFGFGEKYTETDEFVTQIGASKLILTGRFHMMILALATRTPFLAVASNTHKIEATLNDAGLCPWRMVDAAEVDDAMIARASRWHGDEATQLERFVSDGRAAQHAAFAAFKDCFR